MSSMVKKVQKNVEAKRKLEEYTLYGSLIGSIIVTIGKCVEMDESEMIDWFAKFSKDEELAKCKNVKEVCEYIIDKFNMPDEFRKNIVLVYDENNKKIYESSRITSDYPDPIEVNCNISGLKRITIRLNGRSKFFQNILSRIFIYRKNPILQRLFC